MKYARFEYEGKTYYGVVKEGEIIGDGRSIFDVFPVRKEEIGPEVYHDNPDRSPWC